MKKKDINLLYWGVILGIFGNIFSTSLITILQKDYDNFFIKWVLKIISSDFYLLFLSATVLFFIFTIFDIVLKNKKKISFEELVEKFLEKFVRNKKNSRWIINLFKFEKSLKNLSCFLLPFVFLSSFFQDRDKDIFDNDFSQIFENVICIEMVSILMCILILCIVSFLYAIPIWLYFKFKKKDEDVK